MTSEQLAHDRINLFRLVRRLEKSVAGENAESQRAQDSQWNAYHIAVKAQGTLQKLKYAKSLLKNVELDVHPANDPVVYDTLRQTLIRLEVIARETRERVVVKPQKPPLMLSTMSLSIEVQPLDEKAIEETTQLPERTLLSAEETEKPSESLKELLLSPSPEPKQATNGSRRALQTSSAVHEELSWQLAQMATQLKRNALHFSNSLVKDQIVVEEAQAKLEKNHDFITKERTRLRDHSGKSMGTTCLTLTSVIIVIVAFIFMFFIIRLT